MLTQAYDNLVQDVPHLVIFHVVGFGAACAVARAVLILTPKDLMNKNMVQYCDG